MRTTHITATNRRSTRLIAGAAVIAVFATACGSDGDGADRGEALTGAAADTPASTDPGQATDSTEPAGALGTSDSAQQTDAADSGQHGSGVGIQVADGPHRFSELDWDVVGIERRVDGPWDDGENLNPSEDFVYADIDVSSPVPAVTWTVPYQWLQLATDGGNFVAVDAVDRQTGNGLLTFFGVEPNRTVEITVIFAVDADDDLDGAWLQVAQQGYEPTALGGPNVLDEAARLPLTVVDPVYDGPFSRDEARVEIVDVWVSREIGTDEAGSLLDSYDNSSRRPAIGTAHLIVTFDVTCRLTGISTGGCNVAAGQVVVDGTPLTGEINGLGSGPYDATARNWAVYPIPVDATEAIIQINDGRTEASTAFEIADLEPLRSLATPAR